MMRKTLLFLFSLVFVISGYGQMNSPGVTSIPGPGMINPSDSLTIIVNLDSLDCSNPACLNMKGLAQSGEDLFIWTWKPVEHPAGHPLENGIGSRPWKNSNPLLRMTKDLSMGTSVYTYKMVPTDFYGVSEGVVYSEEIHFMVKPEDGGGYGDPDRKSNDLELRVDFASALSLHTAMLPDFDIYPNPAQDHFWVKSKSENLRIELQDLLGKSYGKLLIKGQSRISLEQFKPKPVKGTYLLKVRTGKKMVTKKLIINK